MIPIQASNSIDTDGFSFDGGWDAVSSGQFKELAVESVKLNSTGILTIRFNKKIIVPRIKIHSADSTIEEQKEQTRILNNQIKL